MAADPPCVSKRYIGLSACCSHATSLVFYERGCLYSYRMWHSSCSSGDGKVYVFGGSSTSVLTHIEV